MENIIIALGNEIPSIYINNATLQMCEYIYINSITLSLPIPHTSHVKDFNSVVGPGYIKKYTDSSTIPIAGCYFIYSVNSNKNYVGQSTFLSKRVRELKKIFDFFNWTTK